MPNVQKIMQHDEYWHKKKIIFILNPMINNINKLGSVILVCNLKKGKWMHGAILSFANKYHWPSEI